ncbi:hypothetical protein ACIOWK_10970 [Pseudomonas protegens]|uniref:hypothetical protein n=1 Tax=Pseudomonas protegens TaxID=380021 RepID=UPI001C6955C8|nr:hypothetical protein [Pseudomonas protegens]QYM99297.1 hypothetical protein K1T36_19680 [Pseudomonas protegens]
MPSPSQVALALIFLLASTAGAANDEVSQEWEHLIKADFQDGCVSRLDEYLSTFGNNGVRFGAWLVQTCEGNFEYFANYYPPGVKPEKKRIDVSRTQKLRPLTPAQLKKIYSLKG